MAINLAAGGRYQPGDHVRIPPRKSTGALVWGEVLEHNGAVVLVEVRRLVGQTRRHATWTETYTATELDEAARRFTSAIRRANA